MRITGIETVRLSSHSSCIRIDTSAGISGYGEAVLETAPGAVLEVVDRIADAHLVGEDPAPIERHRRQMQDAYWYKAGGVVNSAFTGIEHALWDIKGKALGVPVHELLGGPVREEVRVYNWIGVDLASNEETDDALADHARERVAEGYDAMKFLPRPDDHSSYPQCVAEIRETVRAVREAVGPDVDLMIDPASHWKLAEARHLLAALEPFDLLFAEDVISPYHVGAVEKLADSTTTPYALGDRLFGLREFEEIIHRDAAAVLQPDIGHAGGLLEIKKIAAAAEHHGIRIAPHNPLGPVATAAAVHVDCSIPNFLIQELGGSELPDRITKHVDDDVIAIEDGRIAAPTEPGLGVTVGDDLFEDPPEVPDPHLFFDRENMHVPGW